MNKLTVYLVLTQGDRILLAIEDQGHSLPGIVCGDDEHSRVAAVRALKSLFGIDRRADEFWLCNERAPGRREFELFYHTELTMKDLRIAEAFEGSVEYSLNTKEEIKAMELLDYMKVIEEL